VYLLAQERRGYLLAQDALKRRMWKSMQDRMASSEDIKKKHESIFLKAKPNPADNLRKEIAVYKAIIAIEFAGLSLLVIILINKL